MDDVKKYKLKRHETMGIQSQEEQQVVRIIHIGAHVDQEEDGEHHRNKSKNGADVKQTNQHLSNS